MSTRRQSYISISTEVTALEQIKQKEWDNFVENHPEGRVCHLVGYSRMIKETFGYTQIYLSLKLGEELIGIFSAFVAKPLWGSRRLISQPFIEYGGPLVYNLPEGSMALFREKIVQIMQQYKARFLEIHGGFGAPMEEMGPLVRKVAMHEYAILQLTTCEELWEKTISRHVRKAVRKAERASLYCKEETTVEGLAVNFYPMYLLSMKRLGSPPFSLAFFLNTLKYLSHQTKLFLVRKERRAIAALLGFTTGKRVHITFSVSDPKFWELRPNDLAHWCFIEWAVNHGYKFFDFGTVRYDSQRQFKKKWGLEFREYNHFYLLPSVDSARTASFNSSSTSVRILSSMWRKWMPESLARVVGPPLHRMLLL